jgi:hypothetical protein
MADPKAMNRIAQTIQANALKIKSDDEKAMHSPIYARALAAARARGLAPSSIYSGLTGDEQRLMNSQANMGEKLIGQIGKDVGEREHLRPQIVIQAGDSPELIKEKLESQFTLGGAMQAGSGAFGAQTTAAGAAARANVPSVGGPSVQEVKEFIRSHPGDPRTPAAMQKLRQMGAL